MSLSRANRSWLKNIWVPLALQVVTIGDIVGTDEPWWGLLLAQVVILPLFVRHRYPMAVLVWVTFAAFATSLLVVLPGSMFAVMVAVYTVATQRDRRSALTGAAVTQVTVIAASIVFNPAADSVIASMVFLTGLNLAAFFLGTTVRANRLYLTSLVERNRQLELERDQQAQLAVAAERTRIAREMHDVVAHSLSVMVTLSDGAVAVGKRDAQAATAAMEQVAATGRQALAEMRRLLNVLRDDQLAERSPQPDLSRLEPMLDDVRATGLEVILRVSGVPLVLAQTAESTIYRIIQESLTNVIKHAIAPTRVVVSLAWEDDGVTLEVVDDGAVAPGSGFDPGDGGYGLRGIRERVALYDGSVQSGPVPPHGWRVRATLSFRQEAP